MATGYHEGEIERLRRALSQAHQELSDERVRSAKLLDEVGRVTEALGKITTDWNDLVRETRRLRQGLHEVLESESPKDMYDAARVALLEGPR